MFVQTLMDCEYTNAITNKNLLAYIKYFEWVFMDDILFLSAFIFQWNISSSNKVIFVLFIFIIPWLVFSKRQHLKR